MLNRIVIQKVQSLYSKGVQAQSSRLSNRHVFSKLISSRSRLVTNEYKKGQKISQWTYQTLHCIELLAVPLNECPCTPQSGCLILRSKYPIPSIMTGANNHIIQSCTSMEGRMVLTETSYEDKKYAGGNKYTSRDPDFFFRSDGLANYLWVTVTQKIPAVSLTALFDNPIDVYNFPSCDADDNLGCTDYLDFDFPIDGDQLDSLIEGTASELIDRFVGIRQDDKNNAIDDINEQGSKR